jgi:hypothetical protein
MGSADPVNPHYGFADLDPRPFNYDLAEYGNGSYLAILVPVEK